MLYYKLICKGEWTKGGWPPISYMELDDERYQTKLLQLFSEEKIAYAYDDIEINGCFLAEGAYVTPEFLADDPDISLIPISEEEFFEIWRKKGI